MTINNARIGEYAFYGCTGLVQVRLNEGVQEIGDCAFDGCQALAEVVNYSNIRLTVGSDDNGQIAKYAMWVALDIAVDPSRICYDETYHLWYYCHYLGDPNHMYDTRVLGYDGEDPHMIVPAALGNHAVDCIISGSFGDPIWPSSAKICLNRLSYTRLLSNLTSLEFIGTEIDVDAFIQMENLETFILPEDSPFAVVDHILYSADGNTLIKMLTSYTGTALTLADGLTLYPYAIYRIPSLVSLTVDGDVTVCGENAIAIYCCQNLTTVTYTDKVTVMPVLIADCANIQTVVLGSNIRRILQYPVGNYNIRVETLTIPATVEYIGEDAFGFYLGVDTLYYNAVNCAGTSSRSSLGAKQIVISENVESINWLWSVLNWALAETNQYDGMYYLAKGNNPYWALVATNTTNYNSYYTEERSFIVADGCEWIGQDMFRSNHAFDWVVIPASITHLSFYWISDLPGVIYYKGAVGTLEITGAESNLPDRAVISYYSESAPTDTAHAYWHYDAQGQPVSW